MTSPCSAVNEIGVQCSNKSFTWANADETTLGLHTACSCRSASPACSCERSERPAAETSPGSPTGHGKYFTEQHSTTHVRLLIIYSKSSAILTLTIIPQNAERCMRIEPERTGWARLSDLFHKYDQVRIQDVKEDIDTLLVFVGITSFHSFQKVSEYIMTDWSFLCRIIGICRCGIHCFTTTTRR